jgi:large subunit ribosomal protein L24
MKVKKNDTVLVLTGKDAGKTGKVLSSIPADNKIKVDGVNVQMRSRKARKANETSAITPQVGAIDASNVLVVCPVCGKATRVGYAVVDGKKIRVCKKCGKALDVTAEAKKAAKKATTAKKTADKADAPKKTRKTTAKKADKAE